MPVPLPAYLMENLDCKVVLVDLCFCDAEHGVEVGGGSPL